MNSGEEQRSFPLAPHLPLDFLEDHSHIIFIEAGTTPDRYGILQFRIEKFVVLGSFLLDESEFLQLSDTAFSW